jgi:hypothetical protein
MAVVLVVCNACKAKAARALGGNYFSAEGTANAFGDKWYEVNMNSDPATGKDGTLFMKAWDNLPGKKVGNKYMCNHTFAALMHR